MTFYWFFLVFTIPRGWEHGIIIRQPSSPLNLFPQGGAGGCYELGLPCPPPLLTRGRWWGTGDNPGKTTNLYLSYILSSRFPGLCILNLCPHLSGASCLFSPLHLVLPVHWQSYTKNLAHLDHKEHPSLTILVLYKPKIYHKTYLSLHGPNNRLFILLNCLV